MPARLTRLAGFFLTTVLLILGGLTGCAAPDVPVTPIPAAQAPHGPVCRIGPDGGPPPAKYPEADRGIGGTGKPANEAALVQTADRGIGGTGIVGVVTGFASICVDGTEVAYDDTAAVDIDGNPAGPEQLRAGDVVAIRGNGSLAQPQARSISARIEVAGRIDNLSMTTGALRIAGQTVVVAAGIPGSERFTLGDWVAVSGLRRPDGVIVASRLDAAPANSLSVRGEVSADGGALRLGTLVLPAGTANPGDWVHVTGAYSGGTPRAASVSADTLCPTPYRCFSGALDHILFQAYVRSEGSQVRMGGILLPTQGAAAHTGMDGAAIVSLERRADGSYAAVDLRPANPAPKAVSFVPPPPLDRAAGSVTRPSRAAALNDRDSGVPGAGHATNSNGSSIASLTAQPADLDDGLQSAATQTNPPRVSAPLEISVPSPPIAQQTVTSLPAASAAASVGASATPPAEASAAQPVAASSAALGAGVAGGGTASGPQTSGTQATDPNQTVSQPIQMPGSPLPVSVDTIGAGVPISSNIPTQGRGANSPVGSSQQTILTTGTISGAQPTGGHMGIPIGSTAPSIATQSLPPPIHTVTPSLPASSSGAAAAPSLRTARHVFDPPHLSRSAIHAKAR